MIRVAVIAVLLSAVAGVCQKPEQVAPTPSPMTSADQEEPSEAVLDAEAAIGKSDWKDAEAKLAPWLAAHPVDARALFDAGFVADVQNRLDDAVNLYKRAAKANPQSMESHLLLGLLLARQGKFAEARPELAQATMLDPTQGDPSLKARAWRALARMDEPSDPATASSDLLEALKLSPETPADTLMAANLADAAGQYDAAETAYRRVLAEEPQSPRASSGLAHVLIVRKQYPEAESLLRKALQTSPGDPAMTAQLAGVLAAEGKPEALPMLQKLHQQHPDTPAITRMLAEMLSESGDFAGSDTLCVEALKSSPADVDLLMEHGENLIQMARYSEAYEAFDKACQVDATNGEAWSGLAFAAERINRPSVALHALTMRSKYLPEVPSTYFLWASAYDRLHQKADAAAYYRHFLDAAGGKFPAQEEEARQRLRLLEGKK